MFKLVGAETFTIGKHKCTITIEASNGFEYEYTLDVDGKSYEKFCENQSKILDSWTFKIKDIDTRVVLEKNTMDIWVNGNKIDEEGEFTENGTETNFEVNGVMLKLVTQSTGDKRKGLRHRLFMNNQEILAAKM